MMTPQQRKAVISNLLDAYVNGLTQDSSGFRSFINEILDAVDSQDPADEIQKLSIKLKDEMENLGDWGSEE